MVVFVCLSYFTPSSIYLSLSLFPLSQSQMPYLWSGALVTPRDVAVVPGQLHLQKLPVLLTVRKLHQIRPKVDTHGTNDVDYHPKTPRRDSHPALASGPVGPGSAGVAA